MSYCQCGGGLGRNEMDYEEAMKERLREKLDYRETVMEKYPGIPYPQAVKLYKQSEPVKQQTEEIIASNWPYIVAVGGGLLMLLMVKR